MEINAPQLGITSNRPPLSSSDMIAKNSAIRTFDWKMHTHLNEVKGKEGWLKILPLFLAAAKIDSGESEGLRPRLRNRFLAECPHKDILFRFQNETNTLPERNYRDPSPLRGNKKTKLTRVEAEALRARNRGRRVGPEKGPVGQKPPKHGQKKDKK